MRKRSGDPGEKGRPVETGEAVDHHDPRAQEPRPEHSEEDRAGAGADHHVRALLEDGAGGLNEIAKSRADHLQGLAEPGLADGDMGDEMGALFFGNAVAERRVFGDEERVVPRPDRLEIEQLPHMPAARSRETKLQPRLFPGRFNRRHVKKSSAHLGPGQANGTKNTPRPASWEARFTSAFSNVDVSKHAY
jgi:hypothetical protein